jgi:hypothetical protein
MGVEGAAQRRKGESRDAVDDSVEDVVDLSPVIGERAASRLARSSSR